MCPVPQPGEPAGYLTVGLLPWLQLQERVALSDYQFEHLSDVFVRLPEDQRETLRLVADTFGSGADPVVCWPIADGEAPTFTQLDTARVHERVRMLAVAAIADNEYFTWRTPANASHFEVVFQRFTPGARSLAIVSRRRDGESVSGGHDYEDTRFHRPQAALATTMIHWDQALLDALATCVDGADSLSSRVLKSAVAFLAANRLDDFSTFDSEVVWATTALEQLLDVSGRDRKKEPAITKTFVSRLVDVNLAGSATGGGRAMLNHWARELYAKRSELHGSPAGTASWSAGWHALLATIAYGICLKRLLAGDGRYIPNQRDEHELIAFPWRASWLRTSRLPAPPSDLSEPWCEAGRRASWRQTSRAVRARLLASNDADDAAGRP